MGGLISEPVSPGTSAHGLAWKQVQVMAVDAVNRKALVQDQLGKMMEVRCDILRAKGNLPEVGEEWIIDRHYGAWIFGAIINGTTRGVEVNNVTGLGGAKAVAKGDIMAASGTDQYVRQPVGNPNQMLVADPSASQGLAYKDGLAAVVPKTGATAATQLVGGTTSGPPTTGTYVKGDTVTAQDGKTWICTTSGSPGTWQSTTGPLEARANKNEVSGKHIFAYGGAIVGASSNALATSWDTYYNDGIVTRSGSDFFLNRVGRWSISAYLESDCGTSGYSELSLTWDNSAWGHPYLQAGGWRGYGGSYGQLLRQDITWTGWCFAANVAAGLRMNVAWWPTSAVNVYCNYYLGLDYLGPL